jgi:hypothetical protein
MRLRLVPFLFVSVIATSTEAFAQAPGAPPATGAGGAASDRRAPTLTFTVGTGLRSHDQTPTMELSVARLFGQHLVLSADVVWWHDRERSSFPGIPTGPTGSGFSGAYEFSSTARGWSLGATALYRTEVRRVTGYAGAGLAIGESNGSFARTVTGCVPPPDASYITCDFGTGSGPTHWSGWGIRIVTGVDVVVSDRLIVYGGWQALTLDDDLSRWTFGMRVVGRSKALGDVNRTRAEALARSTARRMPVAQAIGRPVRVTFMDGTRRNGDLVSLSASEIVVRERRIGTGEPAIDVRHPLANVRLVETRHRKALKGTFIGLAAGAGFGLFVNASCGSECTGAALIFGAIGAASGATAGAIADVISAPRHVVYAGPASGAGQFAVAPIVGRGTGGVRAGWRW